MVKDRETKGDSAESGRHFINEIVEEYVKESNYFKIDANDMIGLTTSIIIFIIANHQSHRSLQYCNLPR
jgi:hypothetical protein